MDIELRKKQIMRVLPEKIRFLIEKEKLDFGKVQEIRMRTDNPLMIIYDNKEQLINEEEKPYYVTREEIRETMEYVSHYSLYAYENELSHGFITIEGGHRVGVTGKVLLQDGKTKNIQYISSVNIRMSHEIIGCSDPVFPYVTRDKNFLHTLVISPPRCGKTTLIRDMARQISDGNVYVKGATVGIVDERSEIGGCFRGVPQNDLGIRTDILDCCPKAEGMILLVRSMSPKVIVVDEIGTPEEINSIEYALHCGCKILASVHGESFREMKDKPVLGRLIEEKRFERYIELSGENCPGEIRAIYDNRGTVICRDL